MMTDTSEPISRDAYRDASAFTHMEDQLWRRTISEHQLSRMEMHQLCRRTTRRRRRRMAEEEEEVEEPTEAASIRAVPSLLKAAQLEQGLRRLRT
jgi:hypothetical protein